MASKYVQGETAVLYAQFKDDSGANASPTAPVKLYIKKPNGNAEQAITLTEDPNNDGLTGYFEHNYTTDATMKGTYYYSFESADISIEQGSFQTVVNNSK